MIKTFYQVSNRQRAFKTIFSTVLISSFKLKINLFPIPQKPIFKALNLLAYDL